MALHVGDVADIKLELKVDGQLTDPSALSIKVRTPSGVETTYSFPSDEVVQVEKNGDPVVGKYRALIPCTEAGGWRYTWTSPGPVAQGVTAGHFHVGAVSP